MGDGLAFDEVPAGVDPEATCSSDSWSGAGWRSLLVRRLVFASAAEDVVVPAVPAQFVGLVTDGGALVDSKAGAHRHRSRSGPGTLSFTAPGRPAELSWRSGGVQLATVHLWIPEARMRAVAEREWAQRPREMPDALTVHDPLLSGLVSSVAAAADAGAGELYAESAATILAVHLFATGAAATQPTRPPAEDIRVARAIEFMHARLGQQVRLTDLADAAQLSAYHFLRVFKDATGRTPSRYLTALRVAEAGRRLRSGTEPVTTIAYDCGFSSPAHLASTFLRETGLTPTAYRRLAST